MKLLRLCLLVPGAGTHTSISYPFRWISMILSNWDKVEFLLSTFLRIQRSNMVTSWPLHQWLAGMLLLRPDQDLV